VASAEATALRRLERDIHDGPQQRLVRLAVDLGRAKQQLDAANPAEARATMDEALAQTRETLDELRTLSRGIAPPILTDRGLSAAVAALAARATVPVELDDPEPKRLDPLAEQTAYFTIAEALTNVAKHSGATRCVITIQTTAIGRPGELGGPAQTGGGPAGGGPAGRGAPVGTARLGGDDAAGGTPGWLTVLVSDDGIGGAQLAKGHGLAGLTDRLHGVRGELRVDSPAGGPTTVAADLPCRILT